MKKEWNENIGEEEIPINSQFNQSRSENTELFKKMDPISYGFIS
jgi:hypothetical protein